MLSNFDFIDSMDIKGKKLLIRVDFNVPLDEDGNITEDTRIRSVLPTINYALDENAMIVLCSHLGRPGGKKVESMSLAPVAKRLARLLEKDVIMAPGCTDDETVKIVKDMKPGEIVLLENLRFDAGEEANDNEFGKKLAALAEVYINDAFATAHRGHASNVSVAENMTEVGAGFLMKNELSYFSRAMENPTRPFVAIVGGKKVSDKVGVLRKLCERVDKLIIGGGMALTFFKALGYEVGKSFIEDSALEESKKVIEEARKRKINLYLPVDFIVADKFDAAAETKIVPYQEIPKEWMALDIGPASALLFSEAIGNAKTIIWNGPMGVFEMDAFSRGTSAMVTSVANTYAMTIVGGGDTDVAIAKAGEVGKMSYISTGGGAFLEILEGKELPGLVAISKNNKKNNTPT